MQTTFLDRINSTWHERAMQGFMVIVLAHWAEHLLQAFQIYALGWPVPAGARRARLLLSVAGQVRDAALRLRRWSC